MARQKKEKIRISEEELNEIGAKQDYYEDRRSKDGFIKITLSPKGASIISDNMDDEIESKQKELLSLKKRKEEIAKLEKKLEKKKSKKEKKKKKDKKTKKDKNLPESSRLLLGAIEDYKDKYHKKKKKGDKKFEGVVTSTRKRTGKEEISPEEAEEKAKKIKEDREKRDFEKKFEEPITLFRQTIVEVDKTLQEIDELIKETKESRARNKATMLKDLLSAKSTLFGNKTANARAMGDLQKVRIDLELKKSKETSAAAAGADSAAQSINMMSKLFPQVVASGGGKKKGSSDDDDKDKKKKKDKDDDDFFSKKDKKKKKKKYSDDDDSTFEKLAAEMVRSGEIELTPHEANIGMEGKFKIAVRKSYKTHDWEFMAIDNHGTEIRGFKDKHPGVLPKKKNANLWFDDERNICKDRNMDVVYPVIQVAYL